MHATPYGRRGLSHPKHVRVATECVIFSVHGYVSGDDVKRVLYEYWGYSQMAHIVLCSAGWVESLSTLNLPDYDWMALRDSAC